MNGWTEREIDLLDQHGPVSGAAARLQPALLEFLGKTLEPTGLLFSHETGRYRERLSPISVVMRLSLILGCWDDDR